MKRLRMLLDSIRGQWLRFLCCTVTDYLVFPPVVYLQSALIYDFLCSLTIKTSRNCFHVLEHEILDNLYLRSHATFTHIWLQSKLSYSLRGMSCVFCVDCMYLGMASWGHMVTLVFNFLKTADSFTAQMHHSVFPSGILKGYIFSESLPIHFIIHLLGCSYSSGCEVVVSHCVLATPWS